LLTSATTSYPHPGLRKRTRPAWAARFELAPRGNNQDVASGPVFLLVAVLALAIGVAAYLVASAVALEPGGEDGDGRRVAPDRDSAGQNQRLT
jgi:hypothetical protein